MGQSALLAAARSSWDEKFDHAPLHMGVEAGIAWAVAASPAVGVNGYAMIPAEGHPWSAGFPRGEDSRADELRARKNLRLYGELITRSPELSGSDAIGEMFKQLQSTAGYENSPDWSLDDFLSAHGGLTYYQHPWVGFDTGHAFDYWDAQYDPNGVCAMYAQGRWPDDWMLRHWTVELVIEEAKHLARQIAEIAELERQLNDIIGA